MYTYMKVCVCVMVHVHLYVCVFVHMCVATYVRVSVCVRKLTPVCRPSSYSSSMSDVIFCCIIVVMGNDGLPPLVLCSEHTRKGIFSEGTSVSVILA